MRKTTPTAIRGEELAVNTAFGTKDRGRLGKQRFQHADIPFTSGRIPGGRGRGPNARRSLRPSDRTFVAAGDSPMTPGRGSALVLALGDARRFSHASMPALGRAETIRSAFDVARGGWPTVRMPQPSIRRLPMERSEVS